LLARSSDDGGPDAERSTMVCMGTIRRLDELGRDDVALAGGKGANLGELTRRVFRCRGASF
jgi:hypothetical protein